MRRAQSHTVSRLCLVSAILLSSPAAFAQGGGDDDGDGFAILTAPTLLNSNGIATNSDASRIYLTSTYGGISVIDAVNHRNIATYDISQDVILPSGIGYAHGKLYVESFREIAVVDATSGRLLSKIDRPFVAAASEAQVIASADGEKIYCVNGSSPSLVIVDPSTDSIEGTIPIGSDHNRIALSLDGTTAYVTNKETGNLVWIDLVSQSVIERMSICDFTTILDFPDAIAVSKVTGDVFVSYVGADYCAHVAAFDSNLGSHSVYDVGKFSTGIDVSPDGRFVVLGAGDVLELWTGSWVARLPVPQNDLCQVVYPEGSAQAWVTDFAERHVQSISGFAPTLRVEGIPRTGETLTFKLDLPAESDSIYQIAASNTIDHGFFTDDGKLFPLDTDALFMLSREASGEFDGWAATLDGAGRAEVSLQLNDDLPIRGPGYPISFAFATFNAHRGKDDVRKISNSVTVLLLP